MALCKLESLAGSYAVMASDAVLQALKRLSVEGFVALRRRGVEVGGLLLGNAQAGEVKIDEFEEMPCEHRYGPSYVLSEADRANLEGALAERAGKGPAVVGFFRSFTSREPIVDEADEAFVREHFAHGWFVYLMLHPISVEKYEVTVRLFRNGVLLSEGEAAKRPVAVPESPTLTPELGRAVVPAPSKEAVPGPGPLAPMEAVSQEVPLSANVSSEMPLAETQSKEPGEPPVSLPPPRMLPLQPRAYTAEREAEPGRRVRWWIAALVGVGCAAAGAWISRMAAPTVTRDAHWKELRMDARPSGDLVEVRWDAGSQGQSATRGRLEVTDGASHREFELNGDQLRSGTLTYQPVSEDVEFRLNVYAKSSEIAGGMVRLKAIAQPEKKSGEKVALKEAGPRENGADDSEGGADRTAGQGVAVPPTETHRVNPTLPEGIRSRMAGPMIIPVQVEVNRRGRVVRAVAETNPNADTVYRYLSDQARRAAYGWRFRPAKTASGKQVSASTTLRFVFTP